MVDAVVPRPGGAITINRHEIPEDTILHRVHKDAFAPDAFNPGLGNARFSPFNGPDGKPVPTIYAAATLLLSADSATQEVLELAERLGVDVVK